MDGGYDQTAISQAPECAGTNTDASPHRQGRAV